MNANGDHIPVRPAPRSMGQAVWEERVMGADIFEIAQKLGITVEQVSDLLVDHHRQRQAQPVEAKSFYRDLAVSRVDALLRVYLPIAVMNSVTVEKVRCGEPVSEESLEHPLHCGAFCLALLKFQSELLGLKIEQPDNAGGFNERGLVDWLRAQSEFVQKIVDEAPRDVIELPGERLDGAQSPAESKTEVSPAITALHQPAAATGDLGEIPLVPKKVAAPLVDAQAQADREQRKRRWLAGQSDGL